MSITASLTDPDGRISSVRWQWYRGTPTGDDIPKCGVEVSDNCFIDRATSATYSPVEGDIQAELTARASYTDGYGSGNTAEETSLRHVESRDTFNKAPKFLDPTNNQKTLTRTERSVAENTRDGQPVSDPVGAMDGDVDSQDLLDYSLSGTDARYFGINRVTAQILTKEPLDFEADNSYTVTVKATDPSNLSATITVTINVTDVNERPEILKKALVVVGDRSIGYAEDGDDEVAAYNAAGPNAANVRWRLTGADASDFSISSSGVLTFRSTPNFESPADANRDNTYEVTVSASVGSTQDSLLVTVDVANVDEEGSCIAVADPREHRGPDHGYPDRSPTVQCHQHSMGVGQVR